MNKNLLYGFLVVWSMGSWAHWASAENTPSLGKSVSWTTSDGVRMVGRYHSPRDSKGWVWVLLHGLGSNKQEWLGFVGHLTAQGDGFLIYDARGHGDSIHLAQGGTLDYREFRTAGPGSPWAKMPDDLSAAVKWLSSRYSLDVHRIAVGGASLGANVALVFASQHPGVPALILLSPGLQYAGIQTEAPFHEYGQRPVFLAASPGDVYAYGSLRQLAAERSDPNLVVVDGEGTAHGVNMLNTQFTKKLLDWMNSIPHHHPLPSRERE